MNMTAERSLEIITDQIAQSRRAVSKVTGQSLFVSAGLGGLIPFRFDATGEIVVLTLRTK